MISAVLGLVWILAIIRSTSSELLRLDLQGLGLQSLDLLKLVRHLGRGGVLVHATRLLLLVLEQLLDLLLELHLQEVLILNMFDLIRGSRLFT